MARIATRAREDRRLFEVLEHVYPRHEFLTVDGIMYPVVTTRVPRSQVGSPNSILGSLDTTQRVAVDGDLNKAGQKYVDFLQSRGHPLRDRATYRLCELNQNPKRELKLDCTVGKYYDALRTCDSLEWEALTDIGRWWWRRNDIEAFSRRRLRLRRYVHGLAAGKDPVTSPVGRSAAIAVSTLILFMREGKPCVLIGERSRRGVAVHGDLFHVIPSGMFQPIVNDFVNEFSVAHNVYREYLEELFGLPEVKNPKAGLSHDFFYRDPNLLFLQNLMTENQANLYLTGLAFNVLNFRPEICTLLHIESPEWYDVHKTGRDELLRVEFNEEWKTPAEQTTPSTNAVAIDELGKFGLAPGDWVPPGFAALHLGLKVAGELGLV